MHTEEHAVKCSLNTPQQTPTDRFTSGEHETPSWAIPSCACTGCGATASPPSTMSTTWGNKLLCSPGLSKTCPQMRLKACSPSENLPVRNGPTRQTISACDGTKPPSCCARRVKRAKPSRRPSANWSTPANMETKPCLHRFKTLTSLFLTACSKHWVASALCLTALPKNRSSSQTVTLQSSWKP